MVSVGGAAVKRAAAEFVFEPIAGSVDGEDFAVVQEAVEDRGSDHVVTEELAPAVEGDVAGDSVESKVKVFNREFSTFAVDWAGVSTVAYSQLTKSKTRAG